MPQSHFTLGEALGKAIGGGFNNQNYDKGVDYGITKAKMLEEARLAGRQNELQSDDSIRKIGMESAGLPESMGAIMDNFRKYGTADAPEAPQVPRVDFSNTDAMLGGVLKNAAPQNRFVEQKPVRMTTTISPENKQKMEVVMRTMAALKQAFAQGDKSTTNATETALANLRASGAGNDNSTMAQLLMHGKPQFDGQANNVTDVVTGDQVLNDYGRSQIAENAAQAKKAAITNTKQASDDRLKTEEAIRKAYESDYPRSPFDGKRPKGAPDLKGYANQWLDTHNVDKGVLDYFKNENPVVKPALANVTPDSIKAAYKAGKMTKVEAEAELKKLGFK